MIPPIIHYIWLGDDSTIREYIESWQKHNPDFRIMRWDDANIDWSVPYLASAKAAKNWANVSNYVRLAALEKYGGIYLDTDVRVLKSLKPLCENTCFFGFQQKDEGLDWVNNAVCGAVPHHWFIKKLRAYLTKTYDGFEAANESSPTMVTKLLKEIGLRQYHGKPQLIKDITLYPTHSFYPYGWNESKPKHFSASTYAVHEWKKRWQKNPIPKDKVKLVMTLLVRDEADIIEKNICFHLAHGVDHIIAMDNNSRDQTTAILKKYAKRRVLTYLKQKDDTYEQAKWVSQMAKYAVTRLHATHLIHADADEFWYPDSGNLKDTLPVGQEVFFIPVLDYLPPTPIEAWTMRRTAVVAPIPYAATMDRELSYRYLLYRYQHKIITTARYVDIIQGNHDVQNQDQRTAIYPSGVTIHHFPVRSWPHFHRKVLNGGRAYLHNPQQDAGIGWQWKEWYLLAQYGRLKDVYRLMCLTPAEKRVLHFRGIIRQFFVPKAILGAVWFYRYIVWKRQQHAHRKH
jgi:glycosyltransferase involved in cell wall biosynthesis